MRKNLSQERNRRGKHWCSFCSPRGAGELPISAFPKNRAQKTGLNNLCRKCEAARNRSPKRRASRAAWLEKRRKEQAV